MALNKIASRVSLHATLMEVEPRASTRAMLAIQSWKASGAL